MASEQKAPYTATASTYNLYLSSSAPHTGYLPHSILFVFFSHSIFCLKKLSSFYVPGRALSLFFNISFHKFPPASLFHSAMLGGLHCYYPHCITGALLKSSHTLSFQKTSVGLKTFCKAHLMGQPGILDLTANSCSLLAVHPAVIYNSSLQNKSLMVLWRTGINSEVLCSSLELSVTLIKTTERDILSHQRQQHSG